MPLPTTSSKAGHLKKHRTLCLMGFSPCTSHLDFGKQTSTVPPRHARLKCDRQQDSCYRCNNSGPVWRVIRGWVSTPTIIVYGAQALQMSPVLWPHIQHSLGLVSTKARIDPGIPKTQDVNPFPRSGMEGEHGGGDFHGLISGTRHWGCPCACRGACHSNRDGRRGLGLLTGSISVDRSPLSESRQGFPPSWFFKVKGEPYSSPLKCVAP